MSFKTFIFCLAFVRLAIAGYVLEDDYSLAKFFSMFSFSTDPDPTHGFVSYVDQGTAQASGMIATNSDNIYIGVDHTNVQARGRPSVRLTSTKSYNQGLVILDLAHMPGGACGTWPAFWMVGPNWPASGEIDIIEGVNQQSTNAMTLHTSPGCTISGSPFSGTLGTTNCDVNAAGQSANAGCQISSKNANSYGDGFNNNNGGVYATEWTGSAISIYFFPRNSIPGDISSGNPDPSGWGTPQATFAGGCDINSHFQNLQIVFDTTFCGDWAGSVWSSGSCASQAGTCADFVANHPSAFTNTFWSVNSLKVYQQSSNKVQAAGVSSYTDLPSPSLLSVSLPVFSTAPVSVRPATSWPTGNFSTPSRSQSTHHHHHHPTSSGFLTSISKTQSVSAVPTVAPKNVELPRNRMMRGINHV